MSLRRDVRLHGIAGEKWRHAKPLRDLLSALIGMDMDPFAGCVLQDHEVILHVDDLSSQDIPLHRLWIRVAVGQALPLLILFAVPSYAALRRGDPGESSLGVP